MLSWVRGVLEQATRRCAMLTLRHADCSSLFVMHYMHSWDRDMTHIWTFDVLQVREELSFAITQPIAHPEQYAAMGLGSATGVLLYGPPGCGKTLVAKAIANESGVNFISIKVTCCRASSASDMTCGFSQQCVHWQYTQQQLSVDPLKPRV